MYPPIIKRKQGRPKKNRYRPKLNSNRRCSACSKKGHYANRCPSVDIDMLMQKWGVTIEKRRIEKVGFII